MEWLTVSGFSEKDIKGPEECKYMQAVLGFRGTIITLGGNKMVKRGIE